ncbi:MAG: hypothetical protein WD598_02750 [Acidimicrobiia bacterium]
MNASRRDVETLLETAGARAAPQPSPEFVTGLEARLLADARPAAWATVVTPLRTRSTGRLRPALASVAAAAAAVVLVGSLAGWFGRDKAQPQPAIASAVDTTVVLPDGSEVAGRDGLDLPDGTIVRTGPDGHAAVGNVDLGPSQVAVVKAGRLEISIPDVTLPPVTLPPVTLPTPPGLPGLP